MSLCFYFHLCLFRTAISYTLIMVSATSLSFIIPVTCSLISCMGVFSSILLPRLLIFLSEISKKVILVLPAKKTFCLCILSTASLTCLPFCFAVLKTWMLFLSTFTYGDYAYLFFLSQCSSLKLVLLSMPLSVSGLKPYLKTNECVIASG